MTVSILVAACLTLAGVINAFSSSATPSQTALLPSMTMITSSYYNGYKWPDAPIKTAPPPPCPTGVAITTVTEPHVCEPLNCTIGAEPPFPACHIDPNHNVTYGPLSYTFAHNDSCTVRIRTGYPCKDCPRTCTVHHHDTHCGNGYGPDEVRTTQTYLPIPKAEDTVCGGGYSTSVEKGYCHHPMWAPYECHYPRRPAKGDTNVPACPATITGVGERMSLEKHVTHTTSWTEDCTVYTHINPQCYDACPTYCTTIVPRTSLPEWYDDDPYLG